MGDPQRHRRAGECSRAGNLGARYRMWYRQGPADDTSIGYAESSDGIHWTLSPRGSVLVPCEQYEMYLPIIMSR